jgi:hypothetical protein
MLRQLTPQEIEQVGGAVVYSDLQTAPPDPVPGLPGDEPPFPPELNPLPT